MNLSVFNHHPILVVDNLILKAISADDINEIDILCSYRPEEMKSTAPELLDKIEKEYEDKNGINWGMYLENKLIGTIGFYRGFKDDTGEIGYVILEQYRRQGHTFKTVRFLVDFGISVMGMKKVKAYTSKENKASNELLKKANFTIRKSDIDDSVMYIFEK
jgi:ribosomal-protein-alanine N-acetyltransferase